MSDEENPLRGLAEALMPPHQRPPKPSVGRVVHYALDFGPNRGQARRADIVQDHGDGTVTLAVKLAPSDMDRHDAVYIYLHNGSRRMTVVEVYADNVIFNPDGAPGTWRWPPVV